jgi:hypothetical protein
MKAYGGVDVEIHIFLTSALAAGEWSASGPCRFTSEERAPGTHWIGGWVGPGAGVDEVEKRKFLTYWDSNSYLWVVQPVASRCTNCAIPAPLFLPTNDFFWNLKFYEKCVCFQF